ncbi:hypothetical protein BDK51DRAFT_48326 [Blyttiomyces helicus]|uniref:Uncharacterized protein n=1 Tax=Blyttiomyces helicus TaxID=388810 RepID=A0A4P9WMU0_9FUNG|nr:hypothetical protein BDK51DRAFT_48326 [Blyttiomyces helicus]|eukprot:RKO92510.1 hypothetical protein BDK51DRAFT_48326 [Blyttiomyces helicus]
MTGELTRGGLAIPLEVSLVTTWRTTMLVYPKGVDQEPSNGWPCHSSGSIACNNLENNHAYFAADFAGAAVYRNTFLEEASLAPVFGGSGLRTLHAPTLEFLQRANASPMAWVGVGREKEADEDVLEGAEVDLADPRRAPTCLEDVAEVGLAEVGLAEVVVVELPEVGLVAVKAAKRMPVPCGSALGGRKYAVDLPGGRGSRNREPDEEAPVVCVGPGGEGLVQLSGLSDARRSACEEPTLPGI